MQTGLAYGDFSNTKIKTVCCTSRVALSSRFWLDSRSVDTMHLELAGYSVMGPYKKKYLQKNSDEFTESQLSQLVQRRRIWLEWTDVYKTPQKGFGSRLIRTKYHWRLADSSALWRKVCGNGRSGDVFLSILFTLLTEHSIHTSWVCKRIKLK